MGLQAWRQWFSFIWPEGGNREVVVPTLPQLSVVPENLPAGALYEKTDKAWPHRAHVFDGTEHRELFGGDVHAERALGVLYELTDPSEEIANVADETLFALYGGEQLGPGIRVESMNVGRRIAWEASGLVSAKAAAAGSLRIRVRLGGLAGNVVQVSPAMTLADGEVARGWFVRGAFVVRVSNEYGAIMPAVGSCGLMGTGGEIGVDAASFLTHSADEIAFDGTAIPVDGLHLAFTADFSVADIDNVVTLETLTVVAS